MLEIRIPIHAELAQQLEDHFCEDYQTCWLLEENWKTHEHHLRGFFTDPSHYEDAFRQLHSIFPALPSNAEFKQVEDRDWKEAYKIHFKPWSDRGLHWVPLWEKDTYQLPAGDQIVYLDPGMAFGTGNHETTRLCVRRLLDARDFWGTDIASKSVIDAGCGSGILAISAAKLGFQPVSGFDNDPDSVNISIDNQNLCELPGVIEFRWADLNEGLDNRSCDVLMANILANVLCDHCDLLLRALNPGGWLILSGILAAEVDSVHQHFQTRATSIWGATPQTSTRKDGEWADVLLIRP